MDFPASVVGGSPGPSTARPASQKLPGYRPLARLLLLAVTVCFSDFAQARPVRVLDLREMAAAPVLVVGEVLAVQEGGSVHDPSFPWSAESQEMSAEVHVLRSYTASGKPLPLDQIRLRFLAYLGTSPPMVGGPVFPKIEPGRVLVLPLQSNKNPASDLWKLLLDEGMGLTIPSRAEMLAASPPPANARAFLLREIANTFSRGTPMEAAAVGKYLSSQSENLAPELVPLLDPAIGNDRSRWAEVATGTLATTGIPRPTIAELLGRETQPEEWEHRRSLFIAQAALRKLGASPQTDNLLIRKLIADAPVHAWGSAGTLLEFADNPVTTKTLRQALKDDLAGSSYIAWTLARNGHQEVLQEALGRALKVANRPGADKTDLQGAAMLLRDYGSDQQLQELASMIRKYQITNRQFYFSLWQYSTQAGNPREARVLAVVLQNRRVAFSETRVCDIALSELEKATGQHFGAGAKTAAERDAALSRALDWLKSEGIAEQPPPITEAPASIPNETTD